MVLGLELIRGLESEEEVSDGVPRMNETGSPTLSGAARDIEGFVGSKAALLIALICSLLAIWISAHNIFKHLVHYNEPQLQKNIVRILFMVPFYALFSFLSLGIPSAHTILDSIRDVYEAFVVYCFLNLMLSYCGGENTCLSVIMHDPGSISHVWPFRWCFPDIAMTSRFLRFCKQWTLQFVIVKPIMAVLALSLLASGKEDKRAWVVTQAIVYNFSYTAALYALLLFYKATHRHPGLKSQYPILKFLSVKLVVFATYYQSVLVSIIPGVPGDALEGLNSFLLCCEMVFFAILQYRAFSWRAFTEKGAAQRGHVSSDFDSTGIEVQEGTFSGSSPNSGRDKEIALSNARNVISMKDVASDAYYNFNNKYGNHVRLDSGSMATDADDSGFAIQDAEGSSVSMEKSESKSKSQSNSAFGRIGTTMRSLASGGRLQGDDDDEFGNSNPFGSSPPLVAPGSHYDDDEGGNGGAPVAPSHNKFSLSVPVYDASKETKPTSNPFEQDYVNPTGLSHQPSSNSFKSDASSPTNDDSVWTADFSDDPMPANQQARGSKKSKKKNPPFSSTDVDLI